MFEIRQSYLFLQSGMRLFKGRDQEKAVNTLKKCFNLDPNNNFKESAKTDNYFHKIIFCGIIRFPL